MLKFEWSRGKARLNREKHGVSFAEAATVFRDTLSITIDDPIHSFDEERYITIGLSGQRRLLVVMHTERDGLIRLISARPAMLWERKRYEDIEPQEI